MKIIVGNNEVKIGKKVYHSFNDRERLLAMVLAVIHLCKFSGKDIEVELDK